MGVEAFILPWLILMSIVAAYGIYSLFRRLVPVLQNREACRQQAPSFWFKQALKLAIVIYALTQVTWILKRVI